MLVPSPYVANNHQFYNAMELVDNKAALLLEEKDFNADNLLKKIDLVINDQKMIKEMHDNSLKLGKINSNQEILNLIIKLVGKDYGENNK